MSILKNNKTKIYVSLFVVANIAITTIALSHFLTISHSNGFYGVASKETMKKYQLVAPIADQLQTSSGIRQYILNELDTTYAQDNKIVSELGK
jgi:hypothetical protein